MRYQNPFIWSYINEVSLYNLISNYNSIDYFNISVSEHARQDNNIYYSLNVDNKINVQYSHYLKGTVNDHVRKNGIADTYDAFAYKYCCEKYFTRLSRMLKASADPVFIIVTEIFGNYGIDSIKYICNIKTKFKRIIITSFSDISQYCSDNIIVINDNFAQSNIQFPIEFIAEKYANKLLPYIINA